MQVHYKKNFMFLYESDRSTVCVCLHSCCLQLQCIYRERVCSTRFEIDRGREREREPITELVTSCEWCMTHSIALNHRSLCEDLIKTLVPILIVFT